MYVICDNTFMFHLSVFRDNLLLMDSSESLKKEEKKKNTAKLAFLIAALC